MAPAGGLLVAGSTQLEIGAPSRGGVDAFVAMLDPESGEMRWAVQEGTAGDDLVTAFPGFQNQGGSDLFVLHFDAAGGLLEVWQKGSHATTFSWSDTPRATSPGRASLQGVATRS